MGKAIWADGFKAMRLNLQTTGEQNDPDLFEPRESIAPTAEALDSNPSSASTTTTASVAEAASFCQMMPAHTLDFIEEPIRDESPKAYEELRKLTGPLRHWRGVRLQVAVPNIERGLTNYARLDICNVGGFTEAMKVAGWAEAHYIDLMPHNPLGPICVAATSHFASAIPNLSWLEIRQSVGEPDHNFYDDDVFPVQPKLEPGKVILTDAPGLGIEVDEASLTEPFKYWEPSHLHQRDGSHTNR